MQALHLINLQYTFNNSTTEKIVKKLISLTLLLILGIASFANSDPQSSTYSVQIGAYKNLSENLIKKVEKFGKIHTSNYGEITRINIGNFDSRSKAQELLVQIKQAGYQDAFISRINTISASSNHQELHQSDSISEMTKYSNLSNIDKDKAVFIHGKLHLKEGNLFIPVL